MCVLLFQTPQCCLRIYLSPVHNRLQLAALYFNENSNCKQLVTRDGQEQYDIVFPKYKKGGYVVRKVLETPTYGNALYLVFHSLL